MGLLLALDLAYQVQRNKKLASVGWLPIPRMVRRRYWTRWRVGSILTITRRLWMGLA